MVVTGWSSTLLDGAAALIVDWDGTLADTRARNRAALDAALAPHRITVDPDWYDAHLGLGIEDLLRALPAAAPLPIGEVIAASRAALLAATRPGVLRAHPLVVDLVRAARAEGMPCAVASNAARVLVDAGLAALELRGLFAHVVAGEDAQRGKPDPELFLLAARCLGVPAADCVAVEDSPDGLAAARAAGMRVLRAHDGALSPNPAEVTW